MALSRGEGSTASFFSWAQAHLAWQLKEDEPGTAGILVPLAAARRASHTLAWSWRGFDRGFLARSFGSPLAIQTPLGARAGNEGSIRSSLA